ncbi:DUF4406 domain-containing protein [uncultured Alistipes sp.]|uniref:DUF4406 domain-containing protein n=1 Tax=uncultured Alistipes sp. TaxID=538949 RepID=UPI0026395A30|nr:DUF4406 domain-containing protein [uncultured Alistipes sp.]
MEKIYISGRISGLPIDEVTAKFNEAEAKLKGQGYEVVNPLKNGIPVTASWEVHVAMDVLLLMGCKAIYLLPDWGLSKGATLEKNLAELTGKTIIYEEVPAFQHIKQAIAEGMGVSFVDIVGESREQKHVFARMIFAQCCREEGATVVRIAKEMKRNHATIIYYLKKYPDDYRFTPEFREYVNAVKGCLSKD